MKNHGENNLHTNPRDIETSSHQGADNQERISMIFNNNFDNNFLYYTIIQ